jgi:hypothetical protein
MLANERRRATVSGTRLHSRRLLRQPGSARFGGAHICRLAQRRHPVQPAAPRYRWLCRVWGRVSSNEIVLASMLPWLSRAWGGVQKALSGRLQ